MKTIFFTLSACLFLAACSVGLSGLEGEFAANVNALPRLLVTGASSSSVGFSEFDGSFQVVSNPLGIDEKLSIVKAWSSTKALYRRQSGGQTDYLNLEISGGKILKSQSFADEASVDATTPANGPYLG